MTAAFTTRPAPPKPITGIVDLHHDDGRYDLGEAAAHGLVALISKATEGGDWVDDHHVDAMNRASRVGLLRGIYHYGNATDPLKQADHFLSTVEAFDNALLILDCEDNGRSRFGTMRASGAAAFVARVHERTGRWPVFYSFTSFMRGLTMTASERDILGRCPLWQAQYGERPSAPASSAWSKIDLWQYTNGADGPHDLSIYPRITQGFARQAQDRSAFFGSLAELTGWWRTAGRS